MYVRVYTHIHMQTHVIMRTHAHGRKEGRKEGTCLFDINNHNTEYTLIKILSGDSH